MNTTKGTFQETYRKTAVIVGVLFIIGTAAGILSVAVSWGLLDAPDTLNVVALKATQVQLTAFLVLVMGLALAMVPAVMFPILKKQNEALAVGYVIFRGALETFTYIALGDLLANPGRNRPAICNLRGGSCFPVFRSRESVGQGTGSNRCRNEYRL